MEIFEILLYILVWGSIVAVGFLIAVLFRVNRILARVESVVAYGEHVKNALIAFEGMPAMLMKKITKKFFGT